MEDSDLLGELEGEFNSFMSAIGGDHPVDCASCRLFYNTVPDVTKNTLRNKTFAGILDVCRIKYPENLCQEGLVKYGPIIFDSLFGHYMNPDYACEFTLALCPKTMAIENVTDYILNVTNGEPDTPLPTPTLKSTFKVLQVSDIHLDPFYQEGAIVDCGGSTVCCRTLPNTTTNQTLSGYWGTLANCDLPIRTAEQMMMFIAENVQLDFIVWTGDNSQHDIAKTSAQNINNTLQLTNLFKQYFPNTPVYPCMGNHETYPLETWGFNFDSAAYSDAEEKIFEQDLETFESTFSTEWLQWLGQDAVNEFKLNGFFSSYNEQYKVRIISLNTNACHDMNFYLLLDPTDPGGMLNWLEQTLATSEKNSENVYIIGHIPPGSSDCYTEWSDRFTALVERYAYIIRGQFFGHVHSDSFFLYKSYADPNKTVQMGFQASSMTPNWDRNPSFRLYTVDADTGIPVNYEQYRLNLTAANLNNNKTLYWDIAYDFQSTYNLPDLSLASYDTLREEIYTNQTVHETFIWNYGAGTSRTSGPNQAGVYCGVLSTIDKQIECYKEINVTVSPDKGYEYLAKLTGPWMNKTISI